MEESFTPYEEMVRLLAFLGKNEASDLHLKVGYAPYVRIGGHLRKLHAAPLASSEYVQPSPNSQRPCRCL